jgi:hypothetical protein
LGSSYLVDSYGHHFYCVDWCDGLHLPREASVTFFCVLQSLLVCRVGECDLEVSTWERLGRDCFIEASFFQVLLEEVWGGDERIIYIKN